MYGLIGLDFGRSKAMLSKRIPPCTNIAGIMSLTVFLSGEQSRHIDGSRYWCYQKASSKALLPQSKTVRLILSEYRHLTHEAVPHHFKALRLLKQLVNLSQHQAVSMHGFAKLHSHLVFSRYEVVNDQVGKFGGKRGSVKASTLARIRDFDVCLAKLQWLEDRARSSPVMQCFN